MGQGDREGGEKLWMERGGDAVAREQQPHIGPMKITGGLYDGLKGHRDRCSFFPPGEGLH